jgi:hypothetical protein
MTTGPIAPSGLIAADDDVVDAWIYADGDEWCHNKITVKVTRWPNGIADRQESHFGLYPQQAVTLAHWLLDLAGDVAQFNYEAGES